MKKNILSKGLLFTALVIGILFLNMATLKAETISFEKSKYTFSIEEDAYAYIYLEDGYADYWTSSNTKVAKVQEDEYTDFACLILMGVGTTTITARGEEGEKASCDVTVTAPALKIKNSNITLSVMDEYGEIEVASGYGIDYEISDTSIIDYYEDYEDYDYSDRGFYFTPLKPGKTAVTVTDCSGVSKKVSVTVTEARWNLTKTELKNYYSEDDICIEIDNEDEVELKAKSSNTKIVNFEDETIFFSLGLDAESVGTATITFSDDFGKKQSCKVTILPDDLTLNKSSIKFDSYEDDEEYEIVYPYDEEKNISNKISTVKSDNTKVATVKKVKYDGDEEYSAEIKPVGKGSATVTVTDQYGQTAKVKVTVSQKYIDEYKYLEELCSTYVDEIIYGDNYIVVSCDIAADVYATIDSKKYSAKVDSEGYYIISGIPVVPAGKEIKIVVSKGEAQNTLKEKVRAKSGKELSASVKAQTYSGKALTPAVTIKDGKVLLQKGTDFTVKYSDNKKVGQGTATIAFKGNYKGAKAATFKINPKPTKLSKVKAVKKGFTVKWKKQTTQTTGYQIQYARNKTFKSGKKTVTIKKNKTTSRKITKLKAKKTYYVRIRTYKTVNGKKYYSAWSKSKKVKTR